MKSLDVAIEELYSAFSDIPAPTRIAACEHCVDDKELGKLLSTDLRKLQPDDLSSYASSAFLTVGDVPDYLFFLPRIMEISVKDECWWPDIEITGRAIRETNPNGWTQNRQTALLGLLTSVISQLIQAKDYDSIDSWMCAIARADLDVRPFLDIIETDAQAVVAYLNYNGRKLARRKLSNAFWELPNEGHDIIVDWLRSEKITRISLDPTIYNQ